MFFFEQTFQTVLNGIDGVGGPTAMVDREMVIGRIAAIDVEKEVDTVVLREIRIARTLLTGRFISCSGGLAALYRKIKVSIVVGQTHRRRP